MNKDRNKKTTCPKKYVFTEEEVSATVSCSVSFVKQVRSGYKPANSAKAKSILLMDEIGISKKQEVLNNLINL